MRNERNPICRLPPAIESELPVPLVQYDESVRQVCCRSDLRQPRRRIPEPTRPRLVHEAVDVILQHARIVQMFETIRATNEYRTVTRADHVQETERQSFRAGGIDHVVLPAAHSRCDGSGGHPRRRELADVPQGRPRADLVRPHDVARVPERGELFPELVEHLRRTESGVVGVVADEQNREWLRGCHRTRTASIDWRSALTLWARSNRSSYTRRPRVPCAVRTTASSASRFTSRANDAALPLGASAAAPVSRHTRSVSRPSVVTTARPVVSAAINDVLLVVAPSGNGATSTSHARSAAAASSAERRPVPATLAPPGDAPMRSANSRLPSPTSSTRARGSVRQIAGTTCCNSAATWSPYVPKQPMTVPASPRMRSRQLATRDAGGSTVIVAGIVSTDAPSIGPNGTR